jgi:outer membrane protein OmpA-like peptidoglycan-associated protein
MWRRVIFCFLALLFFFLSDFAVKAKMPSRRDSCVITGGKMIFEDDFSADSLGTFPGRWFSYPALMSLNKEQRGTARPENAAIRDIDHEPTLVIRSHATNIPITPDIGSTVYLGDSFNVAFDALMEKVESDIALIFYDKGGNYQFYMRIFGNKQIISVTDLDPDEQKEGECSPDFKLNTWQHYLFEYRKPEFHVYIDGKEIYFIADFDRAPACLAISANTPFFKDNYVGFRNFKIFTGRLESKFNVLLSKHKLVTHAIHFEVNKADISSQDSDFLIELADWLAQNPKVKMEIDGHTDDDGGAAANLKLSVARAEAVKAQLMKYGVSGARMTTHGYGATKPIQLNNTPEGKENNRRVEFIKL